ncbi:MAG: 4'-phosphopantetheinyl transferase superfamily protein [Ruminococcaceae bacterium]|nr:4'-phosphopantetheinyl transferase superfamily protein [Oscillospiraceae bacterium]
MLYIASAECLGEREAEHSAAWELLFLMLSALGYKDSDKIARHGNGKPYIEGNEFFFSLAHTDGAVCCAVSCDKKVSDFGKINVISSDTPKSEVGIDIECIDRLCDFKKISHSFFTPEELDFLSGDSLADRFYHIYTRKEALIKATGKGISGIRKTGNVLSNDDIYTYDINLGGRGYKISAALVKEKTED